MSAFDKREDGFERKFVHDEEIGFKALARRNKYLAEWACEHLGKGGPAAQAYIAETVAAGLDPSNQDAVFSKLRRDFDAAGVDISDHRLRREMDELGQKALAEVKASG